MVMWESIQRFGLQYCDLPTMLSNVSAMLRILALNIDGRNKKPIPKIFIMITVTCSILYIYGYVFSAIWFTFWRAKEIGELSGAFIEFSLNVTSEVVIIKLFYMLYYQEKLRVLTNKYLALDARIVKDSRFATNMLKNLRNVKRRGIIYWWILMVDAVVYVVKPLLTPGRHLTVDTFVIYGLEPMLESPNYEIASILMAIDIIYVCYTVAVVTCFLNLITGYIEAQMLSLSEEMLHLYDDAEQYYRETTNSFRHVVPIYHKMTEKETEDKIMNKFINDYLVDVIGRHAMNVGYLKEIEEVMRVPNAIGFLFLISGLIAELLGGLEKTWLQLPFTMLQLSVDCYFGQKVMDANIKFEQAVYACRWEKFNKSNRRIVLVMLQNSQKTMTLSAGGMATLSFTCLMSIIKTTYSAYTTLRSMV